MDPLEAALLVLLVGLPFHLLVHWELARMRRSLQSREPGVVIRREEVLEDHSGPIGRLGGRAIYGSVTFKGRVYRFDRVAEPWYRARVRPQEIFLEPGLVYVPDRPDPPAAIAR